jgi:hypothetical protein
VFVTSTRTYLTPEDLFPDLCAERLFLVAATAAQATNSAFARADAEAGDTTLGVVWTGLDRTRTLLKRTAGTAEYLSFHNEHGIAFSLQIGRVPIRLSRSDKAIPKAYSVERGAQLMLPKILEHQSEYPDAVLRLEMKYPKTGKLQERRVTEIVLKYVNEHTDKCYLKWHIWGEEDSVSAGSPPPSPTPLQVAPRPGATRWLRIPQRKRT